MYPPKFDYYRAGSVAEAISLLGQHGGAKVIAGGHSLLPVMKMRLSDPGTLIDIGRLTDLKGITVTADGGCAIGALTTHAEVAANGSVPYVLSEAASMIGDPQVRNRGTVGGNVAHADPASDLPTVLLALNATFELVGPNGSRSVPAADFFTGLFETAMQEDEILTEIRVPALQPGQMFNEAAGSAYTKMFNPASRYAMVGAAAVVQLQQDGTCKSASVAVGGLTPKATAALSVVAALQNGPMSDEAINNAAQAVLNDLGDDILGDIHASADYRRSVAPVFVARALRKAVSRAQQ